MVHVNSFLLGLGAGLAIGLFFLALAAIPAMVAERRRKGSK